MKLVEFVPPTPHPLWKLCPQMGINDVVVKVNPDLTGLPDPWRLETLSSIVSRLKSAGLNVVGLEGDPFDMSPIKEYGARVGENSSSWRKEEQIPLSDSNLQHHSPTPTQNSNSSREEALEHYRELLESMGKLGIKLLCYNFMVGKGWSRTGVREVRGGAKATYFSLRVGEKSSSSRKEEQIPFSNSNLQLNAEQVWENYEYFIKAVMPTAEKCGVRMALHPDDPCLPSLDGYARIFGSVEAYDRAYALYPSPSNAITFCQANFKLMLGGSGSSEFEFESGCKTPFSNSNSKLQLDTLVDVARHFGKRIAFIHIRDVEGTKEDFTELFHDQGDTDQFALMQVYRELGLDVPVRGDHVPEMAYDRELTPEGTPGYFTLGRLFANGSIKALLQWRDGYKNR